MLSDTDLVINLLVVDTEDTGLIRLMKFGEKYSEGYEAYHQNRVDEMDRK